MLSMYFISKRNNITALLLFILAFSMHVQALMYAFTFLSGVAVYFISSGRPNFRVFLVTVSVVMTSAAIPFINLPFGTKADDYLMRVSQATGLNILSGSSLIILFFALLSVAQVSHQKGSHWKWIWIGALFSFAQATLFMIFGAAFSDIGVRLWQFAFLMFVIATLFAIKDGVVDVDKYVHNRGMMYSIYICSALQAINVIIRYPLSNFFYPLLPYQVIEYVRF